MTVAHQYAVDVVKGTVPAGKFVVKACERFLSDLKRKDIFFDETEAERYINFIGNEIHLWEDEWRGEKITIYPYQAFIIQNIFGWKVKATGKRRFRDAYIQTAKKQAKTTLMAAIAWSHALIDRSTSTPQIIIGANNEDQAKICVNCIGKMVDVSPMLQEFESDGLLKRYQHGAGYFRITYMDKDRDATIEGISKDPKTKAGRNPSLYIIDEYMAAPNDLLLKELHNAQGLRSDPLGIVITTPGFDKYVPCYQKLRKTAVNILNGTAEMDSRFAVLYEPDDEEKWEDESEWLKSNPIAFHIPKVLKNLKADFQIAKQEGGHSIVDFKTKNLGMWCDAASVWIEDEIIKANDFGTTEADLIGRDCYVGWDFSKAKDLSGAGFFFPDVSGKKVFKCIYWIPEDKIRTTEDDVDYQKWVDEGWIRIHEGNVIDHDLIASDCLEEFEKYNVLGIGFDVKYAYQGAVVTVAKAGYAEVQAPIGQGFNLSGAVGQVEEWTGNHEMDLMSNPVTRWCFSNVEMQVGDKGDRYPSKGKSKNKIDGVSCLLNATTYYMKKNAEIQNEVYIGGF